MFDEETHCWLCHRWVDQALPKVHPQSGTVDHVVPLYLGGAPLERSNCRLAHRGCNTARANRMRARRPREQLVVDVAAI